MDEKKAAIVEELLRQRNAEIARRLRVRDPMKRVQKLTKLLAEVLSVRR